MSHAGTGPRGRAIRGQIRVVRRTLSAVGALLLAAALAGCGGAQERLDRALDRGQSARAERLLGEVTDPDARRVAEIRIAVQQGRDAEALRLALALREEGREELLDAALLEVLVERAEREENVAAWGRLQGVGLARSGAQAERALPEVLALPLLLWVLEQPDDELLLLHLHWSLREQASAAFLMAEVMEALDLRLYRIHYRRRPTTTRSVLRALEPWLAGSVLLRKHEAIAEIERRHGDAPEAVAALEALAPDALASVAGEVAVRGVRYAALALHLRLAERAATEEARGNALVAAARAARELGDVSRSRQLLAEAAELHADPVAGALATAAAARSFRDEIHAYEVLAAMAETVGCGAASTPERWIEFEEALARQRIGAGDAAQAQVRLREQASTCQSAALAERGARLLLHAQHRDLAFPLIRLAAEATPEDAARVRLALRHAQRPFEIEAAEAILRQHVTLRVEEGALVDERIGIALIDLLDAADGTPLATLRVALLHDLARRRPDAWHLVRPALFALEEDANEVGLQELISLHVDRALDPTMARARLAAHLLQRGLLRETVRELLQEVADAPDADRPAGPLSASASETLREAALIRLALHALDREASAEALEALLAWREVRPARDGSGSARAWRELLAVPGLTRRLDDAQRQTLLGRVLEEGVEDPLLRLEFAELLLRAGEVDAAVQQVQMLASTEAPRVRQLAERALEQERPWLARLILDAAPQEVRRGSAAHALQVRILRDLRERESDPEEGLRWRGEERAVWRAWLAEAEPLDGTSLLLLAEGEHGDLVAAALQDWEGSQAPPLTVELLRLQHQMGADPDTGSAAARREASLARIASEGSPEERLVAWEALIRQGRDRPQDALLLRLPDLGADRQADAPRLQTELRTRSAVGDAEGLLALVDATLLAWAEEQASESLDSRERRRRNASLWQNAIRALSEAGLAEEAAIRGIRAMEVESSNASELMRTTLLTAALAERSDLLPAALALDADALRPWLAAANLLHAEGLLAQAAAACAAADALLGPASDLRWNPDAIAGELACARPAHQAQEAYAQYAKGASEEAGAPCAVPQGASPESPSPPVADCAERAAHASMDPPAARCTPTCTRQMREELEEELRELLACGENELAARFLAELAEGEGASSRWSRRQWTLLGDGAAGLRWRIATGDDPALLLQAATELAPRDRAAADELLGEIAGSGRSEAAARALASLLERPETDREAAIALDRVWREGAPLTRDELLDLARALDAHGQLARVEDLLGTFRADLRTDALGALVRGSAQGPGTGARRPCAPGLESAHFSGPSLPLPGDPDAGPTER